MFTFFNDIFFEFDRCFALKQIVISISGLYLSSIRSMLFKIIRLNLASGLLDYIV